MHCLITGKISITSLKKRLLDQMIKCLHLFSIVKCLRYLLSCDPSLIQSVSLSVSGKLNYVEQMERNNTIVPNGSLTVRTEITMEQRFPECITHTHTGRQMDQRTCSSYLCLSAASCSEKSLACFSLSDLERFRSSSTFSIWREDRKRSCFYWTDWKSFRSQLWW